MALDSPNLEAGNATSAEITSQPEIWAKALAHDPDELSLLPRAGEPVLVVGCGTSYYIGDSYAQLRTRAGLGRTRAAIPSELSYVDPDEHILLVSRSGTTADVIEIANRHRDTHRVTAILGAVDTPLGGMTQRVVDLGFADERSIVQTRFATTVLTILRKSIDSVPADLIDHARRALTAPLPLADAELAGLRNVVFLGHSWTVGLSFEAALKLREAAGAWTESYPVMEYQHGPISCAGPDTLVWSFSPVPRAVADDIRGTGATLHETTIDPQASLVTVHRLAVALALRAGRNPDTPPFLNRSVLVAD